MAFLCHFCSLHFELLPMFRSRQSRIQLMLLPRSPMWLVKFCCFLTTPSDGGRWWPLDVKAHFFTKTFKMTNLYIWLYTFSVRCIATTCLRIKPRSTLSPCSAFRLCQFAIELFILLLPPCVILLLPVLSSLSSTHKAVFSCLFRPLLYCADAWSNTGGLSPPCGIC